MQALISLAWIGAQFQVESHQMRGKQGAREEPGCGLITVGTRKNTQGPPTVASVHVEPCAQDPEVAPPTLDLLVQCKTSGLLAFHTTLAFGFNEGEDKGRRIVA